MKRLWYIWVAVAALFFSCASNDVVTNQWIQKRKYRDGFYVAHKASKHQPATSHREEGVCRLETINATPLCDSVRTSRQLEQDEHLAHAMTSTNKERTRINPPLHLELRLPGLKNVSLAEHSQAFRKQFNKSVNQDDSDWSISAAIGFGASILSLISLITSIVLLEAYGAAGLIVFVVATLIAIAGLVLSIFGIQDSFQDDKKGKALSIIGTALNGIISIVGLFIIFLTVALIITCASQ
ncbi:MAG: hypothetical protein KDC12_05275 [Flavobacteriales bacterium]|nr:hypothetical protein [Flavobacteriales bacterium]